MAERLTLDDKINGLAAYYEQLTALDPDNMEKDKRPPFYWSGITVSDGLRDAKRSLAYDLSCHARVEYGNRFSKVDLRESDDTQRQERADVLAVMTVPPNPETFYERAEQINEFLGKIVTGEEIAIAEHRWDMFGITANAAQIDTSREIYALFRNGHVSSRILNVQYDTSDTMGERDNLALSVSVPAMFNEGVVTYPSAQAA